MTVFFDTVFKPFFFLNRPWHGPTTDDRSDEFPDGWLPSNHSTYGVCERKHAISNTPKKKNHTLKGRESEGATARLRDGKWGAGKHVSDSGHWLVCSVRCGTILLKPHTGTVPPSGPTYWVLPIQKMSGYRGSPCKSGQKFWELCSQNASVVPEDSTLRSETCSIVTHRE